MALTISNLSKTYPNGVRALKNVSLTIGNNMFGLLGPNGADKSSLMRTVATLQDPDSGAISLVGIDVLKQKPDVRQVTAHLPLIIADAPTAGPDPAERNRFLNLLASIGRDVTVILSTHIVDDVHELCSRMAIIAQGQVLVEGVPSECLAAIEGQIWSRIAATDDELRTLESAH